LIGYFRVQEITFSCKEDYGFLMLYTLQKFADTMILSSSQMVELVNSISEVLLIAQCGIVKTAIAFPSWYMIILCGLISDQLLA